MEKTAIMKKKALGNQLDWFKKKYKFLKVWSLKILLFKILILTNFWRNARIKNKRRFVNLSQFKTMTKHRGSLILIVKNKIYKYVKLLQYKILKMMHK